MNERKLSELQKVYRSFFLEKMKLFGVKSPAELTKEKKSEFFTEIKQDWARPNLPKTRSNLECFLNQAGTITAPGFASAAQSDSLATTDLLFSLFFAFSRG